MSFKLANPEEFKISIIKYLNNKTKNTNFNILFKGLPKKFEPILLVFFPNVLSNTIIEYAEEEKYTQCQFSPLVCSSIFCIIGDMNIGFYFTFIIDKEQKIMKYPKFDRTTNSIIESTKEITDNVNNALKNIN